MVCSPLSPLGASADDTEEAVSWGSRAIELAERLDDTEVLVDALTNVRGGRAALRRHASEARLEGELELAEPRPASSSMSLKCWSHWAVSVCCSSRTPLPTITSTPAVGYCAEHGVEVYGLYALAWRARLELDQGRWDRAAESATLVLHEHAISTKPRTLALVVRRAGPGTPR